MMSDAEFVAEVVRAFEAGVMSVEVYEAVLDTLVAGGVNVIELVLDVKAGGVTVDNERTKRNYEVEVSWQVEHAFAPGKQFTRKAWIFMT